MKSRWRKDADKARKLSKYHCDATVGTSPSDPETKPLKMTACRNGIIDAGEVYATGEHTAESAARKAFSNCEIFGDSRLVNACRSGVRGFTRSLRVDVLRLPPLDLGRRRR